MSRPILDVEIVSVKRTRIIKLQGIRIDSGSGRNAVDKQSREESQAME